MITCLAAYKLICKGNKSGYRCMSHMPSTQIAFVNFFSEVNVSDRPLESVVEMFWG
jgi:hypothetical protein